MPRGLISLRTVMAMVAASAILAFAPTARAESILDQITHRGTLRIAIAASFPFSRMTPAGEPEGYDIEVAKGLAEALHVKPEWIVIDSPGRVTALQTRKADVTIAQFTRTVDRSMTVAFSEPYTVSYPQFLIKASRTDLNATADLNNSNIKVALGRGGTAEQDVPAVAPQASLLRFSMGNDEMRAVNSGQADAAAEDNFFIGAAMRDHPGEYRALPSVERKSDICIGLPAGDPDFLRVVNVWVHEFNASGRNAAAFKKWFGWDAPRIESIY